MGGWVSVPSPFTDLHGPDRSGRGGRGHEHVHGSIPPVRVTSSSVLGNVLQRIYGKIDFLNSRICVLDEAVPGRGRSSV